MFCLDQSTFSRRLRTFWRLPPVFPAFTWGPRYLLWTYRSFCSIISDTSRQNSTRARRRRLLHSTLALPFLFQTRSLYTKYEHIHAHPTVPYAEPQPQHHQRPSHSSSANNHMNARRRPLAPWRARPPAGRGSTAQLLRCDAMQRRASGVRDALMQASGCWLILAART